MRKRSGIVGGIAVICSLLLAIFRDMLFGAVGDWLIILLPDGSTNFLVQSVLPYIPAGLVFILGIMAIKGWGTNTTVHLSKPYLRKSLAAGQIRTGVSPGPDWQINEAMDYIARALGSDNEQDVNAKYSGPAGSLTGKACAGEIKIWGKRLIAENKAELRQREIAASEWNDRELLIWACQPYTRKAQTRSVGQRACQQFTDLYVNESQIKEIQWQGENITKLSHDTEPRYDTPIHEAVDYVARKIHDFDSDKCYPSARNELRKAAFEGSIRMHGKRELKDGYHSDLVSPIPQDFWDDQELNALATSEVETHKDHTQAEMAPGFKTIGEVKEKYWDIRVSMDDVKGEWP